MRLLADSGLWSTGPTVSPTPAVAVLEVSGAVLAWTVDDSQDATSLRITFTDVLAAEWLWRLIGVPGHAAIISALDGRVSAEAVDIGGITLLSESVNPLRRLALGHWLRRWWPASTKDGIASLDRSLLDGEVALLTHAAQDYFSEDTLDSDVVELLAPHLDSFAAHESGGDPRVRQLISSCTDLANEVGAWDSAGSMRTVGESDVVRRADYALAAGAESGMAMATAIARGIGSVNWMAVPPSIFDAADGTIEWSVEMAGPTATALVRVAPLGLEPAAGIEVGVRSGAIGGAGVLDADGRATVVLTDQNRRPITETTAWNNDWSTTAVTVGADLPDTAESSHARQRIRDFARGRLARPGADAFLAELLAAESDY